MKKLFYVILVTCLSTSAQANRGQITEILFSGENSVWAGHADLVQVVLDSPFTTEGCDSARAAVRKSDDIW